MWKYPSFTAQRLRTLEEDSRTINNAMRSFSDEIIKLRQSLGLSVSKV